MSSNEGLVISNRISILGVLHEENVRHVQFPSFMLTAKFSGLPEDFFNLGIVTFFPVQLGLHHKDWDVLVEGLVIFLK